MALPSKQELCELLAATPHPRELAIDVLFVLQAEYGYLSDAAVAEAARLLGMTPLEVEELATFYPFLYRQPVGKYVIHVCDSLICWMAGSDSLLDHLCRRLQVEVGETSGDGLFTLLPVCCLGYCDRAPAMMVNRKVYGHLDADRIDEIVAELRRQSSR